MDCVAELGAGTLAELIALVRRHTGIAMAERKSVLLQGRLLPRMRQLGLASYDDYLARVRAGGPEVQVFIDMVTTHDTLFFRTPAVWVYLANSFLPEWHAAHPAQCLRVWSAAAASGEEAYSIAMTCDAFARRHAGFRYQVLGTDICGAVLARAADGVYGGRSAARLQELHPALADQYFRADGEQLRVLPELKLHVRFAQHNLFARLAGQAPFDLVFLRNVLIYFDDANQAAVLTEVRRQMAPGARLLLGEQESITRLGTGLQFEQAHVYREALAC